MDPTVELRKEPRGRKAQEVPFVGPQEKLSVFVEFYVIYETVSQ